MGRNEKAIPKGKVLGVAILIFVILGTQDKKFPRLLEAVQRQIDLGNIKEEVVAQTGSTKFKSKDIKALDYIAVNEFNQYIEKADIIITHAGVGSILTALNKGKRIIAAARLEKYGEHVNNHQLQILENFSKEGYVIPLNDFEKLDNVIKKVKTFSPNPFKSNNKYFIEELEKEIENIKF